MTDELTAIQTEDGKLPAFAWPGGYTITYLCKDGETVCAKCANEWWASADADGERMWTDQNPFDASVYWEGPPLQCANCNAEMPSEYGDPDASEDSP